MKEYSKTSISMIGCTFEYRGRFDLLMNKVPGEGTVTVDSELPRLKK